MDERSDLLEHVNLPSQVSFIVLFSPAIAAIEQILNFYTEIVSNNMMGVEA